MAEEEELLALAEAMQMQQTGEEVQEPMEYLAEVAVRELKPDQLDALRKRMLRATKLRGLDLVIRESAAGRRAGRVSRRARRAAAAAAG